MSTLLLREHEGRFSLRKFSEGVLVRLVVKRIVSAVRCGYNLAIIRRDGLPQFVCGQTLVFLIGQASAKKFAIPIHIFPRPFLPGFLGAAGYCFGSALNIFRPSQFPVQMILALLCPSIAGLRSAELSMRSCWHLISPRPAAAGLIETMTPGRIREITGPKKDPLGSERRNPEGQSMYNKHTFGNRCIIIEH
jgi:hypothetical protein